MQFHETYLAQPKLAPLVRELSWTHNLLIMSRGKRDEEREFYSRVDIDCARTANRSRHNWRAAAHLAGLGRCLLNAAKLSHLISD